MKITVQDVKSFFEMLGIDLTDDEAAAELENITRVSQEWLLKLPQQVQDKYNISGKLPLIANTPGGITQTIQNFAAKNGLDYTDRRFKKFNEEILPLLDLLVGWRLCGFGKYYVSPPDAPDVTIIESPEPPIYKIDTVQKLEILNVTRWDINGEDIFSQKKICDFIIEKKFNKRFEKNTGLFVVFNINGVLNLEYISNYLKQHKYNYAGILFHATINDQLAVIGRLVPDVQEVPVYVSDFKLGSIETIGSDFVPYGAQSIHKPYITKPAGKPAGFVLSEWA